MPKYMIALRMPRHADKDPATILLCRSRDASTGVRRGSMEGNKCEAHKGAVIATER